MLMDRMAANSLNTGRRLRQRTRVGYRSNNVARSSLTMGRAISRRSDYLTFDQFTLVVSIDMHSRFKEGDKKRVRYLAGGSGQGPRLRTRCAPRNVSFKTWKTLLPGTVAACHRDYGG